MHDPVMYLLITHHSSIVATEMIASYLLLATKHPYEIPVEWVGLMLSGGKSSSGVMIKHLLY